MKFSTTAVLYAANVAAFPAMDRLTAPIVENARLQARQATPPQGAGANPLTPPPFVAALQYVSNKGQYAFVAPTSTDARGMCPGLNALANQ